MIKKFKIIRQKDNPELFKEIKDKLLNKLKNNPELSVRDVRWKSRHRGKKLSLNDIKSILNEVEEKHKISRKKQIRKSKIEMQHKVKTIIRRKGDIYLVYGGLVIFVSPPKHLRVEKEFKTYGEAKTFFYMVYDRWLSKCQEYEGIARVGKLNLIQIRELKGRTVIIEEVF